jgi:predicted RNA-binding Zn ribbon-like protein
MQFSHYTDRPVQLAVDLVNTDEVDDDEIPDIAALTAFVERFEDLRPPHLEPATERDLAHAHRLRDSLRQVFAAPDELTAVAELNSILEENTAVPKLSVHGGQSHLHYEPVTPTVASWLAATAAMGLAGVVVEDGVSRFGSCAADPCRDVFVDTTRNRSRRHCCSTCSTREAVAAYRRRQAATEQG